MRFKQVLVKNFLPIFLISSSAVLSPATEPCFNCWLGESTTTIGEECKSEVALPDEPALMEALSPDAEIGCILEGDCSNDVSRGDPDSGLGDRDEPPWLASGGPKWDPAGNGESTSLVPLLSPCDWLDALLAPLCWTARAAAPFKGTLAEWAFRAAWIACFFTSLSFSQASWAAVFSASIRSSSSHCNTMTKNMKHHFYT